MNETYSGQGRGSAEDYARYLAAMDASMRQKVALTAAHLLAEGRIADLGTGSGGASFAFAQLYPHLRVIGVDVSETMVELARARHRLPNLSFVVGDAGRRVFEPGSLDGIIASSMLHHITSFNGYDAGAARRALAAQVEQLREHGVLVVRDFVDPAGGEVLLDLPDEDGAPEGSGDDPRTCSTARLFERFSRELRSLSPSPGFTLHRVLGEAGPPVPRGFARYRTTARIAAEFILRKDYRADWESEVKEEYTYFSQREFEAVFQELGLRVLTSTPLRNPWIVKHRLAGKVFLYSLDGTPLEYPPTNYLIVGERVGPRQGVDFRAGPARERIGFLCLERYVDVVEGYTRDLVRRPHGTIDVVPWFEAAVPDGGAGAAGGTPGAPGALYVLARTSYPRPILVAEPERARPIDGSRACPWAVEPLTFLLDDRPLGQAIEETLWDYARIGPERLLAFDPGSDYYPSPGGVAERVESMFVGITPTFVEHDVGARSGFSSSGRVQAIEAEQLLRAAQVGGVCDARLELNVYDLLDRTGRRPGPWLGEELELSEAAAPAEVEPVASLLARPRRRRFRRVAENPRPFLEVVCRDMEELGASGEVLGARALEYVLPLHHSAITASVAVLRKQAGSVLMGIDDDDLPAPQCFRGSSNLLVAPAWRLPSTARGIDDAMGFVRERLRVEYGVEVGALFTLGGKYHPTPGATPELVHPFAASVVGESPGARKLLWVPLTELVAAARQLRDGHLRIAALRAAHALGLGPELVRAPPPGSGGPPPSS